MLYIRKSLCWIRIWHQKRRGTPRSWVISLKPDRDQSWLDPDSGKLVPIWSQIQAHRKILTPSVKTLVQKSHSGWGKGAMVKLTFILRIREYWASQLVVLKFTRNRRGCISIGIRTTPKGGWSRSFGGGNNASFYINLRVVLRTKSDKGWSRCKKGSYFDAKTLF